MKISLRGVPCHPKGHMRVLYSLVPINYAMIRAKPSSFDLKDMHSRTSYVIFVKGLSVISLSRFQFFPTSTWYKMTPHEGLAFFDFFKLVTPDSGPAWNDNARNSRSRPGCAESRFNGQSLVKKWHVADPKMFFQKIRSFLISAKVQTHPGSIEIGRSLHKIQKMTPKVCVTKRELICVSQVVYIICVECCSLLSVCC
jgi:hypothetical protein